MSRRNTSKINWAAIQADYVEGWQDDKGRHLPSYRELANKYAVHVCSIRDRGAKDNWVNERARFQEITEQERQKKLSAAVASASVAFDSRCLRTCKTQLRILRGLMANVVIEGRKPGADMDRLTLWAHRISSSLVRVQHVGRVAIGASGDDGIEDWIPESPRAISFARVPRAANAIDPDAA
jgi:hypothetical protein